MSLLRRRFAAAFLCGAAAWTLPGAEAPLPPIAGELSGEVTPLILPGAPAIKWTLALGAGASASERVGALMLEAPGLRGKGEVRLLAPTEGAWRLAEAEVDLAQWFHVVAAKYFPSLVSATLTGSLTLTGEGTIREGKLAGRVALELRDGALSDPLAGWSVQGLALTGVLGRLPTLASDGPFKLTFREATVAGVAARDAAVEFSIDAADNVQVARATAAMFDGGVEMTPFSFPLAKPAVNGDLHFTGIEIAQLKNLLPPVLDAATGRVSGRMSVSYSVAEGIVPGSGRLQIDPGGAASLRLAPQPGFFTSKVPQRLALLPASWGPLAKLFSPVNPAYETLRAIEMGEVELEVNALDVGLRPEGDPAGRTARVVLTARPKAKDAAVESVRFEINVKGPLADVIRMGLEGKVQVRTR